MRRREFIAALGGAVVPALWFSGAHAQQPERMRRIAILMLRQDAPEGRRLVMEFRRRLEALGWADGRNIRADYRWVAGEIDRIGDAAKETVEQRPEVILAEGTVTVAALSRESGAIPIVFINVSDPIGSGFAASLTRPGRMITGFTSNEPTLGGKWPELLNEIAPNVRRIGLLFDPGTAPYAELFLRQAEASARTLAIELFAARIHGRTEIERTMAALASDAGSGLIVLPDPTTNSASDLIIESAARHRIPAIYAWEFEAAAGGLMSYGMDLAESFRGAAVYVDRILRGYTPADLPVQAPTKFKLVLNLRTAKALGIEAPTSTLLRADEVVE
jgi:putative ABC transport system substrate-binding protein